MARTRVGETGAMTPVSPTVVAGPGQQYFGLFDDHAQLWTVVPAEFLR